MGVYFSPTEFLIHPLYLSFIAYSSAIFGISRKVKPHRIGPQFVFITLSFDVIYTIGSLHLVGSYGYFLFLILIQICFGYGVRYGTAVLWAATLVACFGILTLFLLSDFWRNRPFEVISFLAGVPFLAIYIHFLNAQLESAKVQSDIQASTYSRLLKFVSHDIRTQLQALLGASEEILAEKPSATIVKHTIRAREIVYSLARLVTNFVHDQPGNLEPRDRTDSHSIQEECVFGEWLGEVISRFTPQIRANNTSVTVNFPDDVPICVGLDLLSLERLLINSLSNAVRYSKNGSIGLEIAVLTCETDQGSIALRISNSCPDGFTTTSGDDIRIASPRLFFGSGLGHAICKGVALGAGGSYSAKTTGQGSFLCEIIMPCSFFTSPLIKSMAYPVVYFARSVENYQRAKELLFYTCSVYQGSLAHYPVIGRNHDVGDVCCILFDASVGDKRFDGPTESYVSASEGTICNIYLDVTCKDSKSRDPSECAAFAGLSFNSINNAVAFAAAYNQKDEKLENLFSSVEIDDIKPSGIFIEDSKFVANLVQTAALREGWNLEHAYLATQALDMIEKHNYDFVLLDWEFGSETALDFLDVYYQSHSQSQSPHAHIIVLSGHGRGRLRELLGDRRVDRILEKPISTESLVEQIASCLRLDRNFTNPVQESLTLVPQQLFDCGDYDVLFAGSSSQDQTINLLDALIFEIDAALVELEFCTDSNAPEFHRASHRLIGVADSGGAHVLANCVRSLIGELNEPREWRQCDLKQVRAAWVVTLRHIRIFRATLRKR